MPLRQVTFSKKFPYDSFLNYDLGYVWDMEEGETNEEIEAKLLKMANDNHRRSYPHLYQQQPSHSLPANFNETHKATLVDNVLTVEPKISVEEGRKNTIEAIRNCKTLKELSDWKLISVLNAETNAAFQEKSIELTNNQNQ